MPLLAPLTSWKSVKRDAPKSVNEDFIVFEPQLGQSWNGNLYLEVELEVSHPYQPTTEYDFGTQNRIKMGMGLNRTREGRNDNSPIVDHL